MFHKCAKYIYDDFGAYIKLEQIQKVNFKSVSGFSFVIGESTIVETI